MQTRRGFFHHMAGGLMGTALASLLAEDLGATQGLYDLTPKKPHHTPRAKSVIQLFMNGGPSHVDTFDPKPALKKFEGEQPTGELYKKSKGSGFMPSPLQFARCGQSGFRFGDGCLCRITDDFFLIGWIE